MLAKGNLALVAFLAALGGFAPVVHGAHVASLDPAVEAAYPRRLEAGATWIVEPDIDWRLLTLAEGSPRGYVRVDDGCEGTVDARAYPSRAYEFHAERSTGGKVCLSPTEPVWVGWVAGGHPAEARERVDEGRFGPSALDILCDEASGAFSVALPIDGRVSVWRAEGSPRAWVFDEDPGNPIVRADRVGDRSGETSRLTHGLVVHERGGPGCSAGTVIRFFGGDEGAAAYLGAAYGATVVSLFVLGVVGLFVGKPWTYLGRQRRFGRIGPRHGK